MKRKDYYELLEISPQATAMDIIHAYRRAKLAFEENSLAAYTLFSDTDMEELRNQVDEAYHTLSDSEKRREYDAQRAHHKAADDAAHTSENRPPKTSRQTSLRQRIDTATTFPGSLLREIREAQEISVQSIAEHTRISKQYLHAIEDEEASQFPEPVYLKGYLRQYARELGLDAERVVRGYPPLAQPPHAHDRPDNGG